MSYFIKINENSINNYRGEKLPSNLQFCQTHYFSHYYDYLHFEYYHKNTSFYIISL